MAFPAVGLAVVSPTQCRVGRVRITIPRRTSRRLMPGAAEVARRLRKWSEPLPELRAVAVRFTAFTTAAVGRLPPGGAHQATRTVIRTAVRMASPGPFPFTETVVTIAERIRADAQRPGPPSHGRRARPHRLNINH